MNDNAPTTPPPDDAEVIARHPRAIRQKLAHAKDYLAHLELARRSKLSLDGDTTDIDREIIAATKAVMRLTGQSGERIEPRRKVPWVARTEDSAPRPEYFLFLDECGSHALNAPNEKFRAFCLCGILVATDAYPAFDRRWKTWKATWLGSQQVRVHEPDVRKRSHWFHHTDPIHEQAIHDALADELARMPFTCIAGAIDKDAFNAAHATGKVDDFLPTSAYLMCLDFVVERAVHFLYHAGGDARGLVVAESRGLREDAEVHAEFIRLQLEGTQWQNESWFRYQLRPYIEFLRKDINHSGLQIADLVARPIAEKMLQPTTSPIHWGIVKDRLYDGGQGRPLSYGLKVYPTPVVELLEGEKKANGDAEAPPPTD